MSAGAQTAPSRSLDLALCVVTDPTLCGERGVAATAAAAVAGGATLVQLRDKQAADADFVAVGRAVRAALAGTGVAFLVNDRVHLVEAIGADGAHIGPSDLPPAEARALLGDDAYLGLSVGTPARLESVARELAEGVVDYLGVGPVWGTATKADHRPPIGVAGVARIAAASAWPVIAIGGITAQRAPALRGSGAAGVAVVSAVCAAPDPAAAAAELRAAWDGQP